MKQKRTNRYISWRGTVTALFVFTFFHSVKQGYAYLNLENSMQHTSPIFWGYFGKYLGKGSSEHDHGQEHIPWVPAPREFVVSSSSRRPLSENEEALGDRNDLESGDSVSTLRAKISQHQIRISRMKQQMKDLNHEKAFLEKTLELKKGQRTMQDGQVKLSKAELEDKAREIEMYKREAPRTLSKYNELVRKQKEMQQTLNRLHRESDELLSSKDVILGKIEHLSMEDLIERQARGLPDAMAGALRKSAAAVIPFFDYLMIAADTNNRLVNHVGAEIDKYTHVNISQSPFLSGILFYCVMLVPLLTLISFVLRIFDSSSKLTVSHYIILGNFYFVVMCVVILTATVCLRDDPMKILSRRFERPFILGNLTLSIYFIWHTMMLVMQAVYTMEKRDISQVTATLSVGIHYFLFAWRKVFTDSLPMIYPTNYLVYGTVFSFILYERYNRMSNKQVSENAVLRFIRMGTKRTGYSSLWQWVAQMSRAVMGRNDSTNKYQARRVGRRQDWHAVSSSQKSKCEAKERSKQRRRAVAFSSSDEEEQVTEGPTRSRVAPRQERKEAQKQREQASDEGERGGFLRMFFGSREMDSDSTDNESDGGPAKSRGWGLARGANRKSVVEPRRGERVAAVAKETQATRSLRARERRDGAAAKASIWKWP